MNHFMFQFIWIVPIFNTIQILKKILYYETKKEYLFLKGGIVMPGTEKLELQFFLEED